MNSGQLGLLFAIFVASMVLTGIAYFVMQRVKKPKAKPMGLRQNGRVRTPVQQSGMVAQTKESAGVKHLRSPVGSPEERTEEPGEQQVDRKSVV